MLGTSCVSSQFLIVSFLNLVIKKLFADFPKNMNYTFMMTTTSKRTKGNISILQ